MSDDQFRALLRHAEAELRAHVTVPPLAHVHQRVRRRRLARSAAAGAAVALTVTGLFLAPHVRGPERVPLAVTPPPTPSADPPEPPSIAGGGRDDDRRPISSPARALPRLQVQPLAVTALLTEAEVAAHIVVRTSGFGSVRVTVQFAYPTGKFAYATEEETFVVTGTGRNEFVEVIGLSLDQACATAATQTGDFVRVTARYEATGRPDENLTGYASIQCP
ncbi:hypothetical protein AB0M47_17290 [Hamadaea sp. NPDC051192]|uniref:hypothetical protein n=1 Tax=Hamadaea sp. NPDC051192 TaxID=3154940 RepID=UPI00342CE416